jgi:hypothetical protein
VIGFLVIVLVDIFLRIIVIIIAGPQILQQIETRAFLSGFFSASPGVISPSARA